LFDFSLLRTHFCLITKYSVEFRAALRGNFARGAHVDEDVPKGGPGSDNSAFRMALAGRIPCDSCSCFQRIRIGTAPVRYLIFDEVSRFPVQSKVRVKEGDPLALGPRPLFLRRRCARPRLSFVQLADSPGSKLALITVLTSVAVRASISSSFQYGAVARLSVFPLTLNGSEFNQSRF
jgi:hypothetical protein